MIYLAPIQGFTDFVYRKIYSKVFTGIDNYYIPYISVKNEHILRKHIQEILPENNTQKNVIPQVLAKNAEELLFLTKFLQNYGYEEINLNMGCPYPMVTNRGKGSGLLSSPEKVETLLNTYFEKTKAKLSVKIRAGLVDKSEIEDLLPVFEKFPLTELIFHPRTASQLYKGEVCDETFKRISELTGKKLVYNGDIFSKTIFDYKKAKFRQTENWMLGRGVLMNPFLPSEINGIQTLKTNRLEMLERFHKLIYQEYAEKMDNSGNVLNKMKQFWIYFSYSFVEQKKVSKTIKKIKNPKYYLSETHRIFNNFEIV